IPVIRSTFGDKRLPSRGARGEPPEEWCEGCSELKRPVKRSPPEPAILSRTTTARDPPLRKGLSAPSTDRNKCQVFIPIDAQFILPSKTGDAGESTFASPALSAARVSLSSD